MKPAVGRTALVPGVTADIGLELAARLLRDGWRVIGTGRSETRVEQLTRSGEFSFVECELADADSIARSAQRIRQLGGSWELFVSCAGTMEPIGPFFEQDFDAWERSVRINFLGQLRLLHAVWSLGARSPAVMFLAGGGTNGPMPNYSAYCVSKIGLIKMCELIADEAPAANVFIIGPGYVRTRIHEETLRAGSRAGDALRKTAEFLREGTGTSFDDLYSHLKWCLAQGVTVASGRNFSTVHDPWRHGGAQLAGKLRGDPDAFRLRRSRPRA